jgi:8-oxo-dGTP pyrophosphatase MutT (NUDIX family)
MIRQPILEKLCAYKPADDHESQMLSDIIGFIKDNPNCFERSLLTGHITGSCWIVNSDYSYTLLIHHYKLDRWLQPGGHCDGDNDVMSVAMKEAEEETGLIVTPVSDEIFDVDVHTIPSRGDVPEHKHYDIRFLFVADMNADLLLNKRETKDIRWVRLEQLQELSTEESLIRMQKKVIELSKMKT